MRRKYNVSISAKKRTLFRQFKWLSQNFYLQTKCNSGIQRANAETSLTISKFNVQIQTKEIKEPERNSSQVIPKETNIISNLATFESLREKPIIHDGCS